MGAYTFMQVILSTHSGTMQQVTVSINNNIIAAASSVAHLVRIFAVNKIQHKHITISTLLKQKSAMLALANTACTKLLNNDTLTAAQQQIANVQKQLANITLTSNNIALAQFLALYNKKQNKKQYNKQNLHALTLACAVQHKLLTFENTKFLTYLHCSNTVC